MFEINITEQSIKSCRQLGINLGDNITYDEFIWQCKAIYDTRINILEPTQNDLYTWLLMVNRVVGIRQRMKFINYIANLEEEYGYGINR